MVALGAKLFVLSAAVLAASACFLLKNHEGIVSAAELSESTPISGFPDTPAYLNRINAYPANDAMREHGWNLLNYLAPRNRKDPVWRSNPWKPKCGVLDLSPYCKPSGTDANNPIFPGTSRQTPSGGGGSQPVFSTVFYNRDAANFILANGPNSRNTATGLQHEIIEGEIDPESRAVRLPAFPHTSIIVKEIWEGFNVQPDGTALPSPNQPVAHVYIPGAVTMSGVQLEQVSYWPAISIKLDSSGRIDEGADCSDGAAYDETHSVPIQCFYHVHSPEKCDIPTHPPATVGDPPITDYPCYGILVGFQVATAEIDNWTWTTFWWTNNPKSDPEHQRGQPVGLNKQFTHFVMNTTFGPVGVAKEDAGFVFNPYLEGPRGIGTHSDCFNCHSAAVYTPQCTIGSGDPNCTNHHTTQSNGSPGTYPLCPVNAKGAERIDEHCSLFTSHIWSLVTNQDPNTGFPLLLEIKHPLAEQEKAARH